VYSQLGILAGSLAPFSLLETKNKHYYPALTGVRALAAYLVFLFHFSPFASSGWAGRLAGEGHVGVAIFFVLSGFLIPMRYMGQAELSRHWLKRYFQNRVARIYPLYFLLTALTFLVMWRWPAYEASHAWSSYVASDKVLVPFLNFTFLRGFFDQFKFSGLAQGWTLTVEECFYCFAPLLLLFLARTKYRYAALLGAAIGLTAIGLALVHLSPLHPLGFFASNRFLFGFTFFGRSFEFMVGAALALFFRQHPDQRRGAWATVLGTAWIIACIVGISLARSPEAVDGVKPFGIVIDNLVLPCGVAIFFYGLLTERSWLRSLLETKLFDVLGKSSYAFYLVHLGVLSTVVYRYSSSIALHFAVALAVSYLFWRFIEEPVNHWLRSLGKHQVHKQKALAS
jgi:peptidoglycan/LPS O-acetylase OafA/YrhL